LVIFTLLVLAGGGLWLYNMMNQPPPPVAKIQVPSVSALTESEALQRLYNARFSPTINRLPHDTITKGTARGRNIDGTRLQGHVEHLRRSERRQNPD
jgi:serine/threonine-protein kinase